MLNALTVQVAYPTRTPMSWGARLNPKAVIAGRFEEAVENRIGAATFQTASLFNHSCDSNVKFSYPHKVQYK
jgi:hypothetical protein